MALTGRVAVRRAATLILGCLIPFGASSIVAGLEGMREGEALSNLPRRRCLGRCFLGRAAASAADRYDPYAGASVPMR